MSLIIKVSRNGSSQEHLFSKAGPIVIGSSEGCDLRLDDPRIAARLLEIKLSGGNLFTKVIGARDEIYLDGLILPYREEIKYTEGGVLSLNELNYVITIHKAHVTEPLEPPPFFEGEFRERLDRMSLKIREKEAELRVLDDKGEKKKNQLSQLEEKYHKNVSEKGKLEAEVTALKSQRESLSVDLRRTHLSFQETEDKIVQMRDFVKRLEAEERTLKENIIAQNLVLANLREERQKRAKEVDQQRIILANLELDVLKSQESLKALDNEQEHQEREIELEQAKIEKILSASQEALKEGQKIQGQIALSLKEKTLLEHEVKERESQVHRLEEERASLHEKLLEVKAHLETESARSRKLADEIRRQQEEEANLKTLNSELRSELSKIEEKLTSKRNHLNQVDHEAQDITRRLGTMNFELERSGLRLKDLQSEEKAQELKLQAIREDFEQASRRLADDRKAFQKTIDEERVKLEMELSALRREIELEKRHLSETETQKMLLSTSLDDLRNRQRESQKQKTTLEAELAELQKTKSLIESQIESKKGDTVRFQHEKDRAQRELHTLQMKLEECDRSIKESIEEARVEMENFKREERSRLAAEKEVYLAEVETFRQKSLNEVENEYRRKEDELHQKKQIVLKEADEIVREARRAEALITEEANKRLREATTDAHARELASHARVREAQEYFQEKEKEAEGIIQRAKLDSRELLRQTEAELLDDLQKRKLKIKKFLTVKQERGQASLKQMSELHQAKLKREEQKAQEKLEDIKRRELKKVARLREEELSRQAELKDVAMKEVKATKEKLLREINELRRSQEAELAEKKKSMLDHINQTKFRSQKSFEEELRRDRELFERTKKDRVLNATNAVMNVFIAEHGSQGEKEQYLRDKLKATIEMAIDGQKADALKEVDQILDFNPENRKKFLPVIKKYAIRVGVPAAIASVILADAGGLRTLIVQKTAQLMKQQQSASEMYVNQQKTEWKEKHTYTPEQSVGYKKTYVDNMIYTKDFEKVMEHEEFQNDWILKVHDFLVKELELSEDVAISFISSEGTLIKELATARADLHPKFLDVGLKKMTDLEETHLGWLKEKIPEAEKRDRFTNFRKETFDNFYNEKFNSRTLAGEGKP